MTKTERVLIESERTLGSWDNEPGLQPDPYLASRVQALYRERAADRWHIWRPILQLRYAAILTVMVLNLITILYLGLSSRTDSRRDLVSVLRNDLQIDSSEDIP